MNSCFPLSDQPLSAQSPNGFLALFFLLIRRRILFHQANSLVTGSHWSGSTRYLTLSNSHCQTVHLNPSQLYPTCPTHLTKVFQTMINQQDTHWNRLWVANNPVLSWVNGCLCWANVDRKAQLCVNQHLGVWRWPMFQNKYVVLNCSQKLQ